MGTDGLCYELGDGTVVDAVVYGAFVSVGRGCDDVFAGFSDQWWEAENAYVDRWIDIGLTMVLMSNSSLTPL